MGRWRYYGIVAGGEGRVFANWAECEAFRNHNPSGAKYKGFKTREEAEAFIGGNPGTSETKAHSTSDHHVGIGDIESPRNVLAKPLWHPTGRHCIAYTDGSFNSETGVWGYGVVFCDVQNHSQNCQFTGKGTNYAESRNVTGEIYKFSSESYIWL